MNHKTTDKNCISDAQNQAFGCPSVDEVTYEDEVSVFNTTICIGITGQYIAVPSEAMCQNNAYCLDSDSYIYQLCVDESETFVCSNGKHISKNLMCNYQDDCDTSDSQGWNLLFEDEYDCNHTSGIFCTHTINGTAINIWVPPYATCREDGICDDYEDATYLKGIPLCTIAVNCTSPSDPSKEISVYEKQMCDPTGYTYCKVFEKSYIDCTYESVYVSCDYTQNGQTSIVSLDKRLECDRQVTCDNGEDEICLVSTDGCVENIIRLQSNDSSCKTMIDTDYIQCPGEEGTFPFFLHINLMCDGHQDCYQENEEDICPGTRFNRDHFAETTLQNDKIAHFDPVCLPGIINSDSKCEKRLYYYVEELECFNGDLDTCTTKYEFDYCLDLGSPYGLSCAMSESVTNSSEIEDMEETILMYVDTGRLPDFGFKKCLNNEVIPVISWCDTIVDCSDGSDESSCTNTNTATFDCGKGVATHRRFLPNSLKCDGENNCPNSHDECNKDCNYDSTRSIITSKYIPVAGLIGAIATAVNLFSILKHIIQVKSIRQMNSFTNQSFIALIAVGDFLVGMYMIFVLAKTISYGDDYCQDRYEWLSSDQCSFLGIINTTGTLISMLAMTTLSLFRMISLKSMINSGEVNTKKRLKIILVCFLIVIVAITLAIVPVIDSFSTYFVNGLFIKDSPFFTGVANRAQIRDLYHYFGGNMDLYDESWMTYEYLLKSLYYTENGVGSQNPTYNGKRIGFYGNQGVCLFKYFVTKNDPQMGYSLSIIALSATCFIIISCCYIFIFKHAASSTKTSGATEIQRKAMGRLQRKISFIIATDFLTWIPFILICILHLTEAIDATSKYEFCSILLIPINSVINPIIYNGDKVIVSIKSLLSRMFKRQRDVDDVSLYQGTVATNANLVMMEETNVKKVT